MVLSDTCMLLWAVVSCTLKGYLLLCSDRDPWYCQKCRYEQWSVFILRSDVAVLYVSMLSSEMLLRVMLGLHFKIKCCYTVMCIHINVTCNLVQLHVSMET